MSLWTPLYMFLCDHKYLILLVIYLGVEFGIHIVYLCLLFWRTAKQLSKVDTPFYIPTNTVLRFGSNFSIFQSAFIVGIILVGVFLTVILVCISLMTNNFVHIFTAICISSLEKCPFRSFTYFKIGLIFLLLEIKICSNMWQFFVAYVAICSNSSHMLDTT